MSALLDAWLNVAHQHEEETGEVPVVVGVELYEHFGSPATITEINFYPRGMDVTIEGRFGDQAEIESTELVLRSKSK